MDDCFAPEDKYFYLYLLTNPHTNLCGCYEISQRQFTQETGLDIEKIQYLIGRLQNELDVIRYDPETHEVLILNWHRYNWTRSDKLAKAIRESIRFVKSETFRNYLLEILNSSGEKIPYPYPIHTVSVPYGYPMDTSVAAADTVTVSDSAGIYPFNKNLFIVWCQEHGIDDKGFAADFFDRYKACGWTLETGEPIRNWKNVVLSAWRKEKKEKASAQADTLDAIRQRREKEAAASYSVFDAVEYPEGSGQYIGRAEWEAMQHG